MERNKLVYIASPYSGDVERNVAFAKAACRYAMNQGLRQLPPICYIRRCWMMESQKRGSWEQIWGFGF
mgnify:FL=1